MMIKTISLTFAVAMTSFGFSSSARAGGGGSPVDTDSLDEIVKAIGPYIDIRNPISGIDSGNLVSGNPFELINMEEFEACLPVERVRRLYQSYRKKFESNFSGGSLGFLENLGSGFTGGPSLGEGNELQVIIEQFTSEQLDSLHFESFYFHGMSEECQVALEDFKAITGLLSADQMRIFVKDEFGNNINFTDPSQVAQYINLPESLDWTLLQSKDGVQVLEPVALGYNLNTIKKEDGKVSNFMAFEELAGDFVWKFVRNWGQRK